MWGQNEYGQLSMISDEPQVRCIEFSVSGCFSPLKRNTDLRTNFRAVFTKLFINMILLSVCQIFL